MHLNYTFMLTETEIKKISKLIMHLNYTFMLTETEINKFQNLQS